MERTDCFQCESTDIHWHIVYSRENGAVRYYVCQHCGYVENESADYDEEVIY